VLEDLVGAGITDIGIVVGDTAAQIELALGDGRQFGCRLTYIHQSEPAGLAHAVKTAHHFLADDPFVMYLGDNFIEGGIARYVESFVTSGAAAYLLLYPVANPGSFGVAELREGRVVSIEEKPSNPRSNLALVGIYFFTPAIHMATERISPSARGELEITDAIRELIEDGYDVHPHVLTGWWIDTGKMEDMLDANRLVLLQMGTRIDGQLSENCLVQGTVVIERGATVINSTLRGPLIIGEGARIENAYVGPFSSVGRNCVIRQSEIENTIMMERSQVIDLPYRLDASLIGRDAYVGRSVNRPRSYNLMLGDHSTVHVT
jgi:glucose-1-phosphate thymidylyltransferase